MCVGPTIGANSTQPKPAVQQTSEGVQAASPAVWQMLANQGGTMGAIARQKLQELSGSSSQSTPQYPSIPTKSK